MGDLQFRTPIHSRLGAINTSLQPKYTHISIKFRVIPCPPVTQPPHPERIDLAPHCLPGPRDLRQTHRPESPAWLAIKKHQEIRELLGESHGATDPGSAKAAAPANFAQQIRPTQPTRPPTHMPPPSLTDTATSVVTARRRGGAKAEDNAKVHPLPDANGAAEEAGRRKGMGAGWRRPEWCSPAGVAGVLRRHPLPALFGCGLLLFMAVEYTIPMVQPAAPPLDLGFIATKGMHAAVAARPWLNELLAALNTVSRLSPQCAFFSGCPDQLLPLLSFLCFHKRF